MSVGSSLCGHIMEVLGRVDQPPYPLSDSLLARVAKCRQMMNTQSILEEHPSWISVLEMLGTGRISGDYLSVADDVSVYAKVHKIVQWVENLPAFYPNSYEAILERVQSELGTLDDDAGQPTALGHLKSAISKLTDENCANERVTTSLGSLNEGTGTGSLMQVLNTILYQLTVEPLWKKSAESATERNLLGEEEVGSEDDSIIRIFEEVAETLLEYASPELAAIFGKKSSKEGEKTIFSAFLKTFEMLREFSRFADEDDVEALQKTVGTPEVENGSLWGCVETLHQLCRERPEDWERQVKSLLGTFREDLNEDESEAEEGEDEEASLARILQELWEPLQGKLRARLGKMQDRSCRNLCRVIHTSAGFKENESFRKLFEECCRKIQEIVELFEEKNFLTGFCPTSFPQAVMNLWRKLHELAERCCGASDFAEQIGTVWDSPEATTLCGCVAHLVQSFYAPPLQGMLGDTSAPIEGTILARLHDLRNRIEIRKTETAYASLLEAPYLGFGLETPGSFYKKVGTLASTLEQSHALLDRGWAAFWEMSLGTQEDATSLRGIIALLEAAVENGELDAFRQLCVKGNKLIDNVLMAVHKRVLPVVFLQIQKKLRAVIQGTSAYSELAGLLDEIQRLPCAALADVFAAPGWTFLPEFICEVYELLGTNDDEDTTLLGLVQAFGERSSQGAAVLSTLLGSETDLWNVKNPTDVTTLRGYFNWLKAKCGKFLKESEDQEFSLEEVQPLEAAPTVCSCFQVGWTLTRLAEDIAHFAVGVEALNHQIRSGTVVLAPSTSVRRALKRVNQWLQESGDRMAELGKLKVEAVKSSPNDGGCQAYKTLRPLWGFRNIFRQITQDILVLLPDDSRLEVEAGQQEIRIASPILTDGLEGRECQIFAKAFRAVVDQWQECVRKLYTLKEVLQQAPFLAASSSWAAALAQGAKKVERLVKASKTLTQTPSLTCHDLAREDATLWNDFEIGITSFRDVVVQFPDVEGRCCSYLAYQIDQIAKLLATLASFIQEIFVQPECDIDEDFRAMRFEKDSYQLAALLENIGTYTEEILHLPERQALTGVCHASSVERALQGMITDLYSALKVLQNLAQIHRGSTPLLPSMDEVTKTYKCEDVKGSLQHATDALKVLQESLGNPKASLLSKLRDSSILSYSPVWVKFFEKLQLFWQEMARKMKVFATFSPLCPNEDCLQQEWAQPLEAALVSLRDTSRDLSKEMKKARCCSPLIDPLSEIRNALDQTVRLWTTWTRTIMKTSSKMSDPQISLESSLRTLKALEQGWNDMTRLLENVTSKVFHLPYNTKRCFSLDFYDDLVAIQQVVVGWREGLKVVMDISSEVLAEGEPDVLETMSFSKEGSSLPDELDQIGHVFAQWEMMLKQLTSCVQEEVRRSSEDATPRVIAFGWPTAKALTAWSSPIFNATDALQRLSFVLEKQSSDVQFPCSFTPVDQLVPHLQRVVFFWERMQVDLRNLQRSVEIAESRERTRTMQRSLETGSSAWLLGEGSNVFYRHKSQESLFLKWRAKTGVFEDEQGPVEADDKGMIQSGKLTGININDFEPISLVAVLRQMSAMTQVAQEQMCSFLGAFKISGEPKKS